MSPEFNAKLRPVLLQHLRAGARVVSHDFGMEEWLPDKVDIMDGGHLHVLGVRRNICDSAGKKSQEPLTFPARFCRDSLCDHLFRMELPVGFYIVCNQRRGL
jgi:hypothetical protein